MSALLFSAARDGKDEDERSLTQPADVRDIRMSLDGDGDAYRRLIDRHQARVSAMMWRFSRDQVVHEELVQDVFVEAYFSLSGYKAIAPFSNWLARIATRVGYRHWKRAAKERASQPLPTADWHGISAQPEPDVDPAEAADLLHRMLGQLPPRDRLILTLRFVESHSVETAAELTGWSRTMVKVQTWRAKEKLRKIMTKAMAEANT